MRETAIYRSLHGAPMVFGLPVHLILVIFSVGSITALLVNQFSGWMALGVVAVIGLVWAVLAMIYSQDRVAVPMFFLSFRGRFYGRISSFAPSYQRVVIEEE